jgi:hypothetical protein
MKKQKIETLSNLCFFLGFASIVASIAVWFTFGQGLTGFGEFTLDPVQAAKAAYAERFGIFIGLWAPTFFILSNRLDRYAKEHSKEHSKK